MAITRKKQEALKALADAERKLAEYWGVPAVTPFRMNERTTIREINGAAKRTLENAEKPIAGATEKQMRFIGKLLSKDYNKSFKERLDGLKLNKYQASEVINNLLTTDDMIVSPYQLSSHHFEMHDEEMNEIIDLIIKSNNK